VWCSRGSANDSLLQHATRLANSASAEDVEACLRDIAAKEGVAWPLPASAAARVLFARDTRPSSDRLAECVRRGVVAVGVAPEDCCILTTPQLHHIVRMRNSADPAEREAYGSVAGYCRLMGEAYREILGSTPADAVGRGPVHIDCANGVGGVQGLELSRSMTGLVDMVLHNTGETPEAMAHLNDGVGAEHCQKDRLPPAGFSPTEHRLLRCASLDGDADRLVYWYFDEAGTWRLLDGDKIATLAAAFLADQLRDLGLAITSEPTHEAHTAYHPPGHGGASKAAAAPLSAVSVGVVQTAYANGASSRYIRESLRLPVALAKTGVKYVHAAATRYDIGVYFEANGHGTVLLHADFLAGLKAMDASALTPKQAGARARLLAASRLINQAIGDALSDLLFVEAVLALKGWSVRDWDAVYADLPSKQAKMVVPDRTLVKTNEDETRVLEPPQLQAGIDAAVAKYPAGRAFVRPSGTEDVVRIYAEAETQAAADALAAEVGAVTAAIWA